MLFVVADSHASCLRSASISIFNITLLLFAICFEDEAHAEGMSLLINGKSFHKEQPKGKRFNENNWGIGAQYELAPYKEKWRPYLTISGFQDSYKRNSFYAGGGMLRRFSLDKIKKGWHFDAGFIGFIMTRKDYHNRKPFLGALPAFSLGTEKVSINASYVPKVEPKMVPLWFLQLKISLDSLIPGSN